MNKRLRLYAQLFSSTFSLSMFTLGGGYVIVPLMRGKFVDKLHWIEEDEMLNLTALAQSAPGPIAVNASILVGYRIAGVAGAVVTLLGTVLPPLIIISVIALFYEAFRDSRIISAVLRGMQAGVAAVIVNAVWGMGKSGLKKNRSLSAALMLLSFVAVAVCKLNAALVILVCAAGGAVRTLWKIRRERSAGA